MVIRNYHWLNSASRVLISICFAPLVQMGEHKQFSLFDLVLWPTTLTYNPRLAKNHNQRSNGSNRRAPTDKRTDTHTDATKRIISPATQSIKMLLIAVALTSYEYFKQSDSLLVIMKTTCYTTTFKNSGSLNITHKLLMKLSLHFFPFHFLSAYIATKMLQLHYIPHNNWTMQLQASCLFREHWI